MRYSQGGGPDSADRPGSPGLAADRADLKEPSFAQERLWFLDQLAPGSPAYNLCRGLDLYGPLDKDALERALQAVVSRHEALRTNLVEIDGRPVQKVGPSLGFTLPVEDLSALPDAERGARALALAGAMARRPFDLARDRLLRATLIRLSESAHTLMISLHHAITDGWSIDVLFRELAILYNAYSAGRPSPLQGLSVQYADFARRQRRRCNGEVLARQLAYWRTRLAGAAAALDLPTDHLRPAVQTFNGAIESLDLPPALHATLRGLCQRERVTLFMALLAGFKVLLCRLSGQGDLIIGVPVANRDEIEYEDLIGFFVNTLPVRVDLSDNPTFRTLLARLREAVLEAHENQDSPFDKLVDAIQPERDLSRTPVFQAMFAFQGLPRRIEMDGLRTEFNDIHNGGAKFDLTLFVFETAGGLRATLEYNTDLWERSTITAWLAYYAKLLQVMAKKPDLYVGDIPLIDEDERGRVLTQWNDTRQEYSQGCVQDLFESRVERGRDRVALLCGGRPLTYGELDCRANLLARYLQQLGVGPDVPVALFLDRSPELVTAVLAVLKAGGAYVPLDPAHPRDRLAFVLDDVDGPAVLTVESLAARLPLTRGRTVCLDRDWTAISQGLVTAPERVVSPDNLAYVIYTSGSSGRPKGTLLTHRGLTNLAALQGTIFGFDEDSRALQFASPTFDASVFEIWLTLTRGATLIIMRPDEVRDPEAVKDTLQRERVSVALLPPSVLSMLPADAGPSLKTLVVGGEACPPEVAGKWAKRCRLVNAYGPTETTVTATSWPVPEGWPGARPLPLGRPLPNMRVFVLARDLEPVPPGVPGELFIAGDGTARGYLNRPDLTAEHFVPDPFSSVAGGRMYRTGDLAKWTQDGVVEFLGRSDNQVKIRGLRIETGEIEAILRQIPSLKEAVVVAREDVPGDRRLVAYVTVALGRSITARELNAFLRERVPDYMVPADYVFMDSLPMTTSNKVDRRALPAPAAVRPAGESEGRAPPRTPVEEIVAHAFADLLGRDAVSVHDSFFDLGGHSLLATQVVSRLRQMFRVQIRLRDFFAEPTVSALAARVEAARRKGEAAPAASIVPVRRETAMELSYAQQRLWFLDQLAPDNPVYNIPIAIRIKGPLDAAVLKAALNGIVSRHETLRTTFPSLAGKAVQVVAPSLPVELPVVDLAGLRPDEREERVRAILGEEARRPFDLSRLPLLRGLLLRVEDGESILFLSMHHIISDAWSIGVLFKELGAVYESLLAGRPSPLPELAVQYIDFAQWQREWLRGHAAEQLEYWKRKLDGLSALELASDRIRPPVKTYNGARLPLSLTAQTGLALRALGRQERATSFMTLLAAFKALLYRYTGQADVAVGTPVANRNRPEIEGLIGFFVNTLVIRSDLSGSPTFRVVLRQVVNSCLEAYEHQDLPFEELVEAIEPVRDPSRSPLFQVSFVLQDPTVLKIQAPGLTTSPVEVATGTAKFDLTLSLRETGGGYSGFLDYNTDLYDQDTMRRLARHMETLAASVAAHPDRPVAELPLMDERERQRVLVEWNRERRPTPPQCVHELFASQVERTPAALATVAEGSSLTYLELDRRANKLAHYLRHLGVKREALVGLAVERSPQAVVGALAVLKAGGAYVPLDPSYPASRLRFILEDAAIEVLMTDRQSLTRLPKTAARVVCLDDDWGAIDTCSDARPPDGPSLSNAAYVIYTSGSTGWPKGVVVEHRSLTNYIVASARVFPVDSGDRILQSAPLSFDGSVWNIYAGLANGATLVFVRGEALADPAFLSELLAAGQVSIVKMPPALLLQIAPAAGAALKMVAAGGDVCPPALAAAWARRVRFVNAYGPTETTGVAAAYLVPPDFSASRPVPIGRPLPNVHLYVLDDRLEPVPVGVPGELCIGGAGVARGYLGRPDLTAASFMPDPFAGTPGARLYRTGDLVRYLPDGSLDFRGRIDYQVKVRGFRVELGEIEAVLGQYPGVRQAAVVARDDASGDRRLVAYIVPSSEEGLRVSDLHEFLKSRLPEYMVPSLFLTLATMPLTPSGKVDRRALPAPDARALRPHRDYVPLQTELQRLIAGVWEQVLEAPSIGLDDNFFDLGGHSLLLVQVAAGLERAAGRRVPVVEMFKHTTVRSLAEYLEASGRGRDRPAERPAVRQPAEGTKRLLGLKRLRGESQAGHGK